MPEAALTIAECLAELDDYSGEDLPQQYIAQAEAIVEALANAGLEIARLGADSVVDAWPAVAGHTLKCGDVVSVSGGKAYRVAR